MTKIFSGKIVLEINNCPTTVQGNTLCKLPTPSVIFWKIIKNNFLPIKKWSKLSNKCGIGQLFQNPTRMV